MGKMNCITVITVIKFLQLKLRVEKSSSWKFYSTKAKLTQQTNELKETRNSVKYT